MYKLTYKIAAMTDVGLVRTNNEDNLCVISDLDQKGSTWKNNEVCNLGKRGALLVVADGMGGMNAGEVASEIAVSVVKARFTDDIDKVDLNSDEAIVKFMNDSIVIADNTIKSEGKHRPEAKGMGTTIVIAWLLAGKLYVSWCGDSRAYLYNPHRGLVQISKDHSYVQDLVDKGIVKPEDAFDFPESNVITRCLSHSSMKAVPDNLSAPYIVGEGDIVLLCTDGLCGMIRDNEIADVMSAHTTDMTECVECLIEAAKVAAGADNVTVCLCQIMGANNEIGRTNTAKAESVTPIPRPTNDTPSPKKKANGKKSEKEESKRRSIIAAILTLLIAFVVFVLMVEIPRMKDNNKEAVQTEDSNSLKGGEKANATSTQTKNKAKEEGKQALKDNSIEDLEQKRAERQKISKGDAKQFVANNSKSSQGGSSSTSETQKAEEENVKTGKEGNILNTLEDRNKDKENKDKSTRNDNIKNSGEGEAAPEK